MGNTCAPQQGLRFKNFVLAVYPDDPNDGPVRDALGKLQSYVASNPERIPRVCRKISKVVNIYLKQKKVQRVMVGVEMLRELIAHADDVSGFVPHSIEICATLLSHTATDEYRIGAADVMTVLCYKLANCASGEQSSRLISDSKDRLLPSLEKMSLQRINKNDPVAAAGVLNCRYAALVAIGNIAFCLKGALTNYVNHLLTPFLLNLFEVLRGWSGTSLKLQEIEDVLLLLRQIKSGPFETVKLSTVMRDRSMAFISASSWGIGALVGCLSVAGVQHFLQITEEFITSRNGWKSPAPASVVFHSIARAMEGRPQQLGFIVCQYLCSLSVNYGDDVAVLAGIIRALTVCVDEVCMTGTRPHVVFDVVCSLHGAELERPRLLLLLALMRSTHKWRNAPQLHLLLVGLLARVREASAKTAVRALRAFLAVAAYVRTVPTTDRGDMCVVSTITPFLATHDKTQVYALRVLVELIAGNLPRVASNNSNSNNKNSNNNNNNNKTDDNYSNAEGGGGAGGSGVNGANVSVEAARQLVTDEQDITAAKIWILSLVGGRQSVTPLCVIEVGRLVAAILQSQSTTALPFALTLVAQLQAFISGGENTTELYVAWAHLSLVVLANCGSICKLPRLTQYALKLIERRYQVNELSKHFNSRLNDGDVKTLRITNDTEEAGFLLLDAEQLNSPPVKTLIVFEDVAQIIAKDASVEIIAAFSARSPADLKNAVMTKCFGGGGGGGGGTIEADTICTPPLTPRSRTRADHTFSLTTGVPIKADVDSIAITVVDSRGGAEAETTVPMVDATGRGTLFTETTKTRIADLLLRHGVGATTQLVQPSDHITPLPLLLTNNVISTAVSSGVGIAAAAASSEGEFGGTDPGSVVSAQRQIAVESRTSRKSCASSNSRSSPSNLPLQRQVIRGSDNGFHAGGGMSLVTTDAVKLRVRTDSLENNNNDDDDDEEDSQPGDDDHDVDDDNNDDGNYDPRNNVVDDDDAWGVSRPASKYIDIL